MSEIGPIEMVILQMPAPLQWPQKLLPPDDVHDGDWGHTLHCPACNFDYVHIGVPEYKISDNYDAWQGRGDAILIPMFCEGGHVWKLRFGFHKGQSFAAIEDLCLQIEISPKTAAMMKKYTYDPVTRYHNGLGSRPASEAQLSYMRSLGTRNPVAYREMVQMLCEVWHLGDESHFTMAEAGHIISRLKQ